MNLEFTKPQNLGSLLMKSSQSNFNLPSPSSYLARRYLIATVCMYVLTFFEFIRIFLLSYVSDRDGVRDTMKKVLSYIKNSFYFNFFSSPSLSRGTVKCLQK